MAETMINASKKKRVLFEQASRRDPDPIPGDQFKNRGLMDLIAIAETQNPNILSSSDEQVQEKARIFEEYANGGFELLEHQMNGAGDISKQILLFVKSTEKRFDLEDIDVLSFL